MGCNIHTHIEVKKDGVWHHFAAPHMTRDYLLFAVMAGEELSYLRERNKIHPVAKIKGLPEDASLVTRICHEQDRSRSLGIHNESVLSAEDLIKLQEELYRLSPWIERSQFSGLDLEWSIFRTYINGNTLAQHQGWDDLRVIFWFDN